MPETEETKKIEETKTQPAVEVQEPPFYNVLQPAEKLGTMVNPKIKIQTQDTSLPETNSPIQMIIHKYKTTLILVGVILLLAYPAYWLINKFVLTSPEPENILVTLPNQIKDENTEPETNPEIINTQTPPEWQKRFFSGEKCFEPENCGDLADPDKDGLKNLQEFELSTDPNNSDSDQDGLADGDEVNIFNSNPSKTSTVNDETYNDGQYIKGAYNPNLKDKQLTASEIDTITQKIKNLGIHQPTIRTLGESLLTIYKISQSPNTEPTATSTPQSNSSTTPASEDPLSGLETTAEAKQDRDTQRSNSIKNIAIALVKFNIDKKVFPKTTDFGLMYAEVKIYSRVAINPQDPINKDKYLYTYAPEKDGQDFVLTFFSESQNQYIKTRSADGKKYILQDQSAIYDDQRKINLDSFRSALLVYSSQNVSGNQEYVFPLKEQLQKALVPTLIGEIPKDPKTNEPYEYQVSEDFQSFTLKALLDAPPVGKSGYLCNQEECRVY